MRLSAQFEDFFSYLKVEKEAAQRTIQTYRWCLGDFMEFATKRLRGPVVISEFTSELCRAYQYDLAARSLQTNSVRVRLGALGSFGKWAVRHDRLERNPLDRITRPRRKKRLPAVPRWEAVQDLIGRCSKLRDRAILALLAYGGLRRTELVSLDVGDFAPEFGLRRVQGKGGHEAAVPLPQVARSIVSEYLARERPEARPNEPLFVVRFKTRGKEARLERMRDHRVFKLVRALGIAYGLPGLHPHAFRHACGVELLRRTRGNLRAVQDHLRHQDIQTTTIYTRLTQDELSGIVSVFDRNGE